MRAINGIMYLVLAGCIVIGYRNIGNGKFIKYKEFVRNHFSIFLMLFVFNSISFAMTFIPNQSEIYVEKGDYGEESVEIPLRLEKEECTEDVTICVAARELTEQELEKKIAQAFSYLQENIKGDNPSLDEVRNSLNYSLDYEMYPFDMECVSTDYALIDREGGVKNEIEEWRALGYDDTDMQQGIEVQVTVTLW